MEHEKKNKLLLEEELKDELLADQEEKGIIVNNNQEEDLMNSAKQREGRILLGMHAVSEGMYKNLQKERKGVLNSYSGSKLPNEIQQNIHFSN